MMFEWITGPRETRETKVMQNFLNAYKEFYKCISEAQNHLAEAHDDRSKQDEEKLFEIFKLFTAFGQFNKIYCEHLIENKEFRHNYKQIGIMLNEIIKGLNLHKNEMDTKAVQDFIEDLTLLQDNYVEWK